jgi:hypothetical protein
MRPWDIELVKITNIQITFVTDIKKRQNMLKSKNNSKIRYKSYNTNNTIE